MKNTDSRGGFEKAWEKAFNGAEMTPPEALWSRVESGLYRAETVRYKRRALVFKWMAAASLILATGLAVHNFYLQPESRDVAGRSPSIESATGAAEAPGSMRKPSGTDEEQLQSAVSGRDAGATPSASSPGGERDSGERTAAHYTASGTRKHMEETASGPDRYNQRSSGDAMANPALSLPAQIAGLVPAYGGVRQLPETPDHLYLVPVMPTSYRNIKVDADQVFYAGLNVAAGRFNPNFSGGPSFSRAASPDFMAKESANFAVDRSLNVQGYGNLPVEQYAPDAATSYGMDFGMRVASRWILQTGFLFTAANSRATTMAYIQPQGADQRYALLSTNTIQSEGSSELNITGDIELANSYSFASLPLQAGYIVFEEKLSLTLLAGLSTDFFLGNKVSDPDNFITTVQNKPGDASPYRNVLFSGLVGTSLGYDFAGNYRVRIDPGLRLGINTLTKENIALESRPNAFMLSFGLSYRFD